MLDKDTSAANTKQVHNENAGERRVTLPCEIENLSEPQLLTLLLSVYQAQHLEENAIRSFAVFAGCSYKHISHCLSVNQAHLGFEAWTRLLSRVGSVEQKIWHQWIDSLEKKMRT